MSHPNDLCACQTLDPQHEGMYSCPVCGTRYVFFATDKGMRAVREDTIRKIYSNDMRRRLSGVGEWGDEPSK